MVFRWLKKYMPRGLYGRAALILVLPVVTLQLMVSIVFIQRHFDGVTNQMTRAASIEVRYVQRLVAEAPNLDAAKEALAQSAPALEMLYEWPATIPQIEEDKLWTDFTGGKVRSVMLDEIPELQSLSLADRRRVTVWFQTQHGPLELSFSRRRVSASNPHQLLVIMAVMGALMTLIAGLFLRNQLRPIKRMAAAAQEYGKGRIAPFHPTGAVEVRAAGTAFLDMRNRIERQSQSRTMMLSGISHDLRTPLTRLRLGLSLMDETEAAPLIADVDDMQQLVDGFLDFARSEALDDFATTDVADLLGDVVSDARRAGQAVTLNASDAGDVMVPLRVHAVRRALENLIGNALRYGSHAYVSVQVHERAIVYVVEDNGPGIPAEKREQALRPFVRLDPARNQNKGSGVGLGLSIVSDIARSHGGVLRLGESATYGGLKAELVLAR
jgi:two-component system osmolarity sensor histidine kinase EnvZ